MLHSFPMMIANSVGGGGYIIQGSGLFGGTTSDFLVICYWHYYELTRQHIKRYSSSIHTN